MAAKRPQPKITGTPPEFAMISKGDLKIDHTYQRPVDMSRARRIAAQWNWRDCGFIAVSMRENGEYYIFDGQHRHAAAMMIDEVEQLPCEVNLFTSVVEEAEAYRDRNRERRPLQPLDIARAGALIGDPVYITFFDLCKELDLNPSKNGTAVGTLRPIDWTIKNLQRDMDATTAILRLVAEITRTDRLPISSIILGGLMYIHNHGTVNLYDPIMVRCVRACGALTLEQAATNAVSRYSGGNKVKGGDKMWATGMIEALDRQRRRLPRAETRKTPKFALQEG
jgi:hypothetical protein